ncbi:MAG: hypothetical protein AAGE94_20830, partial [Acidobacteriota bacterium]
YEVAGSAYSGDRYDFSGPGKSSGYESKAEVVAALPAGTETDCWFDPDDPSRSVIEKDAGWFLLWGLLPLPFLLVGIGSAFVFFTIPKAERLAGESNRSTPGRPMPGSSSTASSSAYRHEPTPAPLAAARQIVERHTGSPDDRAVDASVLGIEPDPLGGLALEPQAGRKSRVVGLLFVALFWNGIVSVFLWQAGIFEGSIHDGCSAIFLIPFVLIGIGLIVGWFHQLLNLVNPLPHLRMNTPRPEPGQTTTLEYRLTGATHRIGRFEIRLRGREAATYRRGTSTSTSNHTFYDEALVSVDRIGGGFGTVTFEWPADAMPTFRSSNNRIDWSLRVRGDIRFWPDVAEDFAVPLYPPADGGFGS